MQEWLHFGYQKLRLPRKGSASLKTKMFLTRQIVCHLPADFLAVKKEFSWLKNCCSSLSASMSATCKSLWNFERRKNKKSGSTTPFFLVVTGELSRKLYLVCCKLESVNKIFLWGFIPYPYGETKNKFSYQSTKLRLLAIGREHYRCQQAGTVTAVQPAYPKATRLDF